MKMMGSTFTYVVGSDASALFFNSKNEDLNAEEIYGKLVTPVFGKGVAYDVPNNVRKLTKQKKLAILFEKNIFANLIFQLFAW